MKNFRIQTWKLRVEGQFESEEEAIKELADRYMQCSKCDPPNEHFIELINGSQLRNVDTIAKGVFFYVYEEVYGIEQWIEKYQIDIFPFKKEHWWESKNGFEFKECEFRYNINSPEKKEL